MNEGSTAAAVGKGAKRDAKKPRKVRRKSSGPSETRTAAAVSKGAHRDAPKATGIVGASGSATAKTGVSRSANVSKPRPPAPSGKAAQVPVARPKQVRRKPVSTPFKFLNAPLTRERDRTEKLRQEAFDALRRTGDGRRLEDISIDGDKVRIHERRRLVKDGEFTVDLAKLLRGDPVNEIRDAKIGKLQTKAERSARQASVVAPALKVLEQTARPLHAVAGATNAAIEGKNVPRAALRGVQNRDKVLFSDVLKNLGAPKVVQGIGGFALDVGLDPTTYVTGGAAAVGRNAAIKAGKKAQKQAAKGSQAAAQRAAADSLRRSIAKGVDAADAAKVARKAGDAARDKHLALARERGAKTQERVLRNGPDKDKGRGVEIKFAGRAVPVVTRATAAATRGTGKVARKVTPTKARRVAGAVGGDAKNIARDFRPTLTPAGMDRDQFQMVHDAAATARGQQAEARDFGQRLARAVQKRVPKEDWPAVIKAIERNQIGKLPERLQQPARRIRSDLREGKRRAVRSGVAVKDVTKGRQPGDAKGYYPHTLAETLGRGGEGVADEAAPVVQGVGRKTIKLGATNKRGDRRPIDVINAAAPGKFSEDIPLTLANHFSQLGTAAARSTLNQVLSKVGREVRWKFDEAAGGDAIEAALAKGEALYRINGSDIKKLDPSDKFKKQDGGRYFVLNKELADKELASLAPAVEASTLGRRLNQGTLAWKRAALFSAAYHIRNAIGDSTLAYYAQPGRLLARNTLQAGKILAADRRGHKQIQKLEFATRSGRTVKVAGERKDVEDVLRDIKGNAAMQTGFVGRELEDLVGRDADGAVKKVRRGNGKISGTLQARENLMRVGTAKAAMDRGLSPAEAGRVSRSAHIDYGDLTDMEKKLRRAAVPFYTFAARNIPIQAKALVQTPGKIANLQKIREEAARSLGLEEGWEKDLPEYQQRNTVFPIGVRPDKSVRVLDFGLPLSGINELPVGINPVDYIKELNKFGTQMLGPAFKVPIELTTGIDTFQRRPINSESRPNIPAPSWAVPFGLTTIIRDPKSGKPVPGWSGTAAYIARQLTPGPVGQASQLLTKGTNSRGQPQGLEKTFSVLSGIRVGYTDKINADTNRTFEELDKVKKQIKVLAGRPNGPRGSIGNDGFYTPEYERLLDRQKELNDQKDRLLRKGGRVPKVRGKRRPVSQRGSSSGRLASGRSQSEIDRLTQSQRTQGVKRSQSEIDRLTRGAGR